jgi:4-alpha-glucanotransferase
VSVAKLRQLARAYGVQAAYYDVDHKRREASPEALLAALRALGAPMSTIDDAPHALRDRTQFLWRETIEPVVVSRGQLITELRLPTNAARQRFHAALHLESGPSRQVNGVVDDLPTARSARVEGTDYVAKRLAVPGTLPPGYHRLTVELPARTADVLVISAPAKVFDPWTGDRRRAWGAFLPLYALHSHRTWAVGDLADLERLADWVAQQGGHVTATLPLLASFWEQTADYSPYAPVSRLFWNEFYLNITRLAGFDSCTQAKALCTSAETQRRLNQMRAARRVDYDAFVELKSRLLRTLSAHFFQRCISQRASLDQFVNARPDVHRYARFRAACERHGLPWTDWPEPLRAGRIDDSDVDPAAVRHHLYVQWQVAEQLDHLTQRAGEQGAIWYLDLPLGVSRAGFDTWLERDAFALSANGGAPPDSFFSKGQNWFVPPLHPLGLRRQRYRYLIAVLRQHFRYAKLLRIDHAAALHRLYWIPEGMDAAHGAYVRYPADELYAILALESHTARAGIVGENLGTVPRDVTRSLRRHGIQGMYILPFEVHPERKPALRAPGALTLAALNTHDMPPFAAFWKGADIDQRIGLELLHAASRNTARNQRRSLRAAVLASLHEQRLLNPNERKLERVLEACLVFLARSSAELVLLNLEDLWLETAPQNMPGTFREFPNWCRKAALSLDELREDPRVLRLVQLLRQARNAARPRNPRRQ